MDESESTADEPAGSVTRWIGELKAGDGKALQPLWDRYHARLVERARAKLGSLRSATPVNDEEDVASSAFHMYVASRDFTGLALVPGCPPGALAALLSIIRWYGRVPVGDRWSPKEISSIMRA